MPRNDTNLGLLHADFELDNLVWQGEQVGVLDFDDCVHGWFVADIAFALRDAFDDSAANVDLQKEVLRAFVGGYRGVRRLADEELDLLPTFLTLHNVVTFVKMHRALGEDTAGIQPDLLANLRAQLTAKLKRYREGFSEVVSQGNRARGL